MSGGGGAVSKTRTQTPQPPDVFAQLALRLKQLVHDEHINNLSGVERFTVRSVSPLIVEHMDGNLVLEDGDPDFTVGAWFRQFMLNYTLVVGDQAWCLREGQEWHLIDVSDPSSQEPWSFVGHTHSDPQGGSVGPGTMH